MPRILRHDAAEGGSMDPDPVTAGGDQGPARSGRHAHDEPRSQDSE